MKKIKCLYFILMLICGMGFPLFAQNNNSVLGKTYALIIGISQYQNTNIPRLNYADKDATLFADWLKSKAGGSVPGYQIKLLINEDASIAPIYTALDWLIKTAAKNDRIYLYFSGHGDVETDSASISQGYLLAWNSPQNNYANNAIRIEDINKLANTLSINNKAKVILITDACHSGKMAGDFFKGKQLTARNLQTVLNNEVRMASCAVDEEAAEGPNWGGGRGVFSYYLLQGLKGMGTGAIQKNDTVKLKDLSNFLDSAFAADKELARNNHKQHPVIDGSPLFAMAVVKAETLAAVKPVTERIVIVGSASPMALQSLQSLGRQPIDYFFELLKELELHTTFDFELYGKMQPEAVPLKMINDYIQHLKDNRIKRDSVIKLPSPTQEERNLLNKVYAESFLSLDTLELLQTQLLKNNAFALRFNERFIQMVHAKSQDMINAYLNGSLAEYQKRQYDYTGRDSYKDLFPSLQLVMHLIPPNYRLAKILNIQYSYICGLVDRMKMATSDKFDSLLITAFQHQQQALLLEPYAAYIHNELGNLYFFRKQYDSAEYHLTLASVLSPTWVVPWSNKISMYLALNKIDDAINAINKTDSLQPGLGFSMINAGLLMEQSSNWLAAESFYQRAIAQNKNHYLPYERLANVYLNTGNFAKADFYFFESDSRKQALAVNDRYFKFGQMMLGRSDDDSANKKTDSSCITRLAHIIKWQPYIKLANGLRTLKDSSANKDMGIQLLRDALTKVPNISFAHHYLGKELYRQGKWKIAEKELLQAVSDYRSETDLRLYLKKRLYGNSNTDTDSCLLELLMSYEYDVLEDHYLLGSIYEKQQLWSKAIKKYQYISSLENSRQINQALLKGIQYAGQGTEQSQPEYLKNVNTEIKNKFDKAVNMGGYIKAIRLYESQGDYLQAEKILLNQVSLSRDAGYARQKFIDTANWKYNNQYHRYPEEYINYFWLNINRTVEMEACNFYKRMEDRFPRDHEWKEKAGLFLFKRLMLTYEQIPIEQRQEFYESYRIQYPFRSLTDMMSPHDNQFTLPGTAEELVIIKQDLDPVISAISFLEQSIKLSGEFNGSSQTLEMLGDLNSWAGKTVEAITCYNKSLELQPDNIALRNKLINYLVFSSRLPEALIQLEYLNQQNQITHQQKLLLANFHALSGQYNKAISVISNYQPGYEREKYFKMAFFAQQGWLSGDTEKALRYLNDSLPDIGPESTSPDARDELYTYDPDLVINMTGKTYFPPYFKARLYAMKKDDKKALAELQKAIEVYFGFYHVLEHDSAWDHLRNTGHWQKIMALLSDRKDMRFESEYYDDVKGYYNSYLYKIPKYKKP